MSIQFIDLKAQYHRLKDDIDAGIHAVLDDGRYVLGPAVMQFEAELAEFCDCKHVISASSGTDALLMPMLAKNIGPGCAVFVPSFTYTSTAEVILLAGATPVFVEVDAQTFLIDIADLEAKISAVKLAGELCPSAIMPVDLFGQPADYAAINAIAEREKLFVIADAAQALGGAQSDQKIGGLTHCTATSFYPSKPLGCYGDGGAVMTNDDELADVLRSIRSHGKGEHKYDVVRVGMNGRLDSIQAAILSVKLACFADELDSREDVARFYDDNLQGVETPARVRDSRSAWAQYTVKSTNRAALQAHLKEQGVPSMVFYPVPMHLQPAYSAHGDGEGALPISERLSHEVMSLPMYPFMPQEDRQKVVSAVNGFMETRRAA